MNKTYLYFTKARIALILITIGSLVWLGFQLNTTGSWWETLINLAIGVYITVVMGCLEADLIKRPPENFEPLETLIEYGARCLILKGYLARLVMIKREMLWVNVQGYILQKMLSTLWLGTTYMTQWGFILIAMMRKRRNK